jgi:hypothetical protein
MEPELITEFLDWLVLTHLPRAYPPLPIGLNGNRIDIYWQDDFRIPIQREQMIEWAGNFLRAKNRNEGDNERLADAAMELVRQKQSWERTGALFDNSSLIVPKRKNSGEMGQPKLSPSKCESS